MKHLVWIIYLLVLSLSPAVWSQDGEHKDHEHKDHKHEEEGQPHKHEDHDEEEAHEGHSHKDEKKGGHAHGAEESDHEEEGGHGHGHGESGSNVGPEKGILEASEDSGIRLSPQALKNFEIQTTRLSGAGPWTLPSTARLLTGEEANLYRLRNGFFKRIDFNLLKKTPEQITVSSKALKAGDEVVINGIGFLRISELAAFGGAPEGHSH